MKVSKCKKVNAQTFVKAGNLELYPTRLHVRERNGYALLSWTRDDYGRYIEGEKTDLHFISQSRAVFVFFLFIARRRRKRKYGSNFEKITFFLRGGSSANNLGFLIN